MNFIATLILSIVIVVLYLLDLFVLVPKDVNKLTKEHIFFGDRKGFLSKSLRLSYTKIKQGQIWRLVSSVFLHVGIPHIVFNTCAILFTGYAVESAVGWWKMLLGFFFSAFISGLFMCFAVKLEDGEGASTGIYGLIAMYLIIAVKQKDIFFSSLPWYLAVLIGVYTIGGMLIDKTNRQEHTSGFIGGLIFGLIFI